MVILLLIPIAIPIKMTLFPTCQRDGSLSQSLLPIDDLNQGNDSSNQSLLSSSGDDMNQEGPFSTPSSSTENVESSCESEEAADVMSLLAKGWGAVRQKRKPRRGENFNLRQAVIKADFWLVWSVFFIGVGSGVTVLNNLAQIGDALGVNDTTILLAVFSFCNFVGGLGTGAISEHFVRYII